MKPDFTTFMKGIRQLELERPSDPGLALVCVMLNQSIETNYNNDCLTPDQLETLNAAAARSRY